jgi:hypothetical protein
MSMIRMNNTKQGSMPPEVENEAYDLNVSVVMATVLNASERYNSQPVKGYNMQPKAISSQCNLSNQ